MFGVPPEVLGEIPVVMVGHRGRDVRAARRQRRERWGFSYIVIHEPEVDAFAPVVDRLAGT